MVTIEKRLRTDTPQVGVPVFHQIHAHSTGNPSSTLQNEVDNQVNNRPVAFATHTVGNGRVVQTAPTNRGAYDVGGGWNCETYAAVELIESHKTQAEFNSDYKLYIDVLRQLADEAKLPKTLDTSDLSGVKTHYHCTYNQPNNGSDHVDPYPYLQKWNISKAQFKKDVENGIGTTPVTTPPNTGTKIKQGIYTANDVQFINGLWQIKCNFLVPANFSWADNGISVEDVAIVDKDGYLLKDQTTKNGSYFVFDTNKIVSVTNKVLADGGYYWSNVKLKNSGSIWLSVVDKNDLINKVSNH